jgi:hypothetical protein
MARPEADRMIESDVVQAGSRAVFSRRLILVGVPRCGSTWSGAALARTEGTSYLLEPDHPLHNAYSFRAHLAMRRGPRPLLLPGEPAPAYADLWNHILHPLVATSRSKRSLRNRAAWKLLRSQDVVARSLALLPDRGRPTLKLRAAARLATAKRVDAPGDNLLIKSVFAPLTIEWIASRFEVEVIVLLRNPLNVIPSWIDKGWDARVPEHFHLETNPSVLEHHGVRPPKAGASALSTTAWRLGLLTLALQKGAERHPEWTVVTHERLCERPVERFRELCTSLELPWSDAVEDYLDDHDERGSGDRLQAERWRRRFTPGQVEEICEVMSNLSVDPAPFGVRDWSEIAG